MSGAQVTAAPSEDDLQEQVAPLVDALSDLFSKHASRLSMGAISYAVLRYLALVTVFLEKDDPDAVQWQHDLYDGLLSDVRDARVEGRLHGFNPH